MGRGHDEDRAYRLVDGAARDLENPEEADGRRVGGGGLPRQAEMMHASWVFLFASVTLLLAFLMLGNVSIFAGARVDFTESVFLVSCIAWLYAFGVLLHWVWVLPGPSKDWWGLSGAALKLVASALFNVQPLTALALGVDRSCAWSNLVGICFFHAGNIVSCCGMLKNMCGWARPCSLANWPVVAMHIYLAATTLLVAANVVAYGPFGLADELSPEGLSWLQCGGSALLCVGSVLYVVWSTFV